MNDRSSLARLAGRPLLRMNGIGNVILVLDLRGSTIELSADEARAIAALPGLRFDQLMTIHDPVAAGIDAAMRIYNTDGSRSSACGNGTRCVASYLWRDRPGDSLVLATEAGPLMCHRQNASRVAVDMGPPRLRWQDVPLAEPRDTKAVDLGVDSSLGRAVALGMGNPHAVFFVPDAAAIDLPRVGPALSTAAIFPEGANISFAQVVDREHIRLRVWERGAGATLACGTGACASLVAAAVTGRTDRAAEVDLPGGRLSIEWRDDDHVVMTGPAELEFETTLDAYRVAETA